MCKSCAFLLILIVIHFTTISGTARVTVRSIHPVNSALSYTASAEVHVVEPLQLIDSPNVERSFCNCDNCIGCPTK
eukprot:Awhi_evm1s13288